MVERGDVAPTTSVHWVPSDPGTRFVKDPAVVVAPPAVDGEWKALTPNVLALPSGGFRLYYTLSGPGRDYGPTRAAVLSCFSPDGLTGEPEAGERIAPFGVDAAVRVVCPDVVPIPAAEGGGWRMYLEGQPADPRASVIVSARSADGLAWEPEPGMRFSGPRRYGSPRVVVMSDSPGAAVRYRMYFHSYSHPLVIAPDAENHIVSAVSADGLSFTARSPACASPRRGRCRRSRSMRPRCCASAAPMAAGACTTRAGSGTRSAVGSSRPGRPTA
jgi:hypothetical protein